MTAELSYPLETVNDEIAAGWTALRLYRDEAPDGAFATLVDTETLVADQLVYEFTDATGGAAHWYRVALYNGSSLAVSTKGDPFRINVTTLLDVIAEAASLGGAGFKSACTSVGTVSSLIDVGLIDSGVANDFLEAGYLYRPDAALAADKLRRVAAGGFDFTSGALRPTRDWTNAPAEDEVYHVFLLLPPFPMPGAGRSWADAAREGLSECEYEDTVDVGTGTAAGTDEFDLGPHLGWLREGDVRRVRIERYNAETGAVEYRQDAGKNGRYWKTQPNGRGNLKLIVRPYKPKTTEHVIVEANRRDAEIYAADDVTGCPLSLAAKATLWKAYEYLDMTRGKYASEAAKAYAAFLAELRGEAVAGSVQT